MQPTGRTRVLIADDNADSGQTLGHFMELLGCERAVVGSGRAALEAATRSMPQVVILDIGMPDLDGWSVCREIRKLPGGNLVRIIALSGYGSDEARAKSKDAGFDAHWTKPAEATELIALLKQDS